MTGLVNLTVNMPSLSPIRVTASQVGRGVIAVNVTDIARFDDPIHIIASLGIGVPGPRGLRGESVLGTVPTAPNIEDYVEALEGE